MATLVHGTIGEELYQLAAIANPVAQSVAFLATGTWTPSGSTTATYQAKIVGGGGGGGAGGTTAGGGGGGGGEVRLAAYLGNVLTAQTVTIGAGGVGAAATAVFACAQG